VGRQVVERLWWGIMVGGAPVSLSGGVHWMHVLHERMAGKWVGGQRCAKKTS